MVHPAVIASSSSIVFFPRSYFFVVPIPLYSLDVTIFD